MDVDYKFGPEQQLYPITPWVGLSVITATAVCTLAMAADAFNGIRRKKLWFPCKYFSLNATSLTFLALAVKLPMSLNAYDLLDTGHLFATVSSLIFMTTAMSNFMSSLGAISNKEILANLFALGFPVIKIVANGCLQFFYLLRHSFFLGSMLLLVTIPVPLLLATLVSSGITVPTTKRKLESKYQEKHKGALREENVSDRREAFKIDDQRREMMKYWVMAETSSPQFVIARSVVSTTSALIPLVAAISLPLVYFQLVFELSPYMFEGYIKWILIIQFIGVIVGIIAPTLRWYVAVSFECSTTNRNSFKKEFKIETHWIQTMVDWRDSSTLRVRPDKYTKYLHDAKWFVLTFGIGIQMSIVLLSKLFVFLSALLILQCSRRNMISNNQNEHESDADTDLDLGHYVLLLDGEKALPRGVLKSICRQADNTIQTGKEKQPKNLIDLLHRFVEFNGVGKFDSNQIPSQEPPNCWTLPVMTLTSIAIALPNIAKDKVKQLLRSVSEGFSLAKIVDKTLDDNARLVNIRKAANISWVGVVFYRKWLHMDLRETSLRCKNFEEVLQELSTKAEGIVMEFKREVTDSAMQNPLNWPAKVVAANSMYRISRTMLLSCGEGENEQTGEGLFELLSVMIADILAACFTNLPHVITTMCHSNCIEKREKSVRKAFLLLGKTEQVVELLQQQEWPPLGHDKAADIEEWRAWFRVNKDDPAAPSTSTLTPSDAIVPTLVVSGEEQC